MLIYILLQEELRRPITRSHRIRHHPNPNKINQDSFPDPKTTLLFYLFLLYSVVFKQDPSLYTFNHCHHHICINFSSMSSIARSFELFKILILYLFLSQDVSMIKFALYFFFFCTLPCMQNLRTFFLHNLPEN